METELYCRVHMKLDSDYKRWLEIRLPKSEVQDPEILNFRCGLI